MEYDETFLSQAREALQARRQQLVSKSEAKVSELLAEPAERKGDSIDITTAEQTDSTELRLQDRQKDALHEIEHALRKLDDEEYGECEECGDMIGRRRLEIQPTARYCVECQADLEEEARRRYKRPGLLDEFGPE